MKKRIKNFVVPKRSKINIKGWEDKERINKEDKEKENEEKEEFQECKFRTYGMNGVGKQTNSSHDSIQRSIIMRMDDGKGIGRRVNQNPHHSEELRQSLKEGP